MNLMTIPPLSGADPSSDSVVTSSAAAESWGVARSAKFQPGLERSYHRRMRIKIGPSARIDGRVQNSQTFLWCSPDTGPLARDFLQEETREANLLAFRGSGDNMEESIFQPYLSTRTIFKMDREILRPSYLPDRLPHPESPIRQLAHNRGTRL